MTPDEQELFAFASRALPEWYSSDERANEYLGACAKVFAAAKLVIVDWLGRQTRILDADGPATGKPDFLAQHARDRGTSRRLGEDDAQLRARIRSFPDAISRPALLAGVTAILTHAGITEPPTMIEFPRDQAYLGSYVSDVGVGGTFMLATGGMAVFTPTAGFRGSPFLPVFPVFPRTLVLSGAASAGNIGAFATLGVVIDGALYANGSAVAGADAGVAWSVVKHDLVGNVVDGHPKTFASRGYRAGSALPAMITILPYGTTEVVRTIVEEYLRQFKSGGVISVVERRSTP